MTIRVNALEARQLIDAGIRVIDVLPPSEYIDEHLPGAENLPLEKFEVSQVDSFDRSAPLLVYCFDQH